MFNFLEIFNLFNLFNLLSLLYVYRALQLLVSLIRQWSLLRAEPLTPQKSHLAEQAAFFIAVPPSVLVHELCHALAIWLFGGQVVEFGFRVFWGYVVPQGQFSPPQDWFISLAGTLGNLLFGGVLWLLLRRSQSGSWRYFALRALRFQVYFSLVYYPLFTLVLPIGDWRTIYDFAATPLLSGLTAVAHAALLYTFWRLDQRGWFEMPVHQTLEEQEQLRVQRQNAQANPQDPQLQLAYWRALSEGRATNSARRGLRQFLAANPQSAEGHLQLARLESQSQREIGQSAVQMAQKALSLGLANRQHAALAHEIIGQFHLDRGAGDQAADHLSQALTAVDQANLPLPVQAHLLHLRSQAYRRQRQYSLALTDIEQAIRFAQGHDRMVQTYQGELAVIREHAKRPLPT